MKSNKQIFFRPERCLLCLSCVLACQKKAKNLEAGRIEKRQKPSQRLKVTFSRGTPWIWKCWHCNTAPCIEACITGALHLDSESHTVVQDREACVGCGSCVLACPFEGIGLQPGEDRPEKCDGCLDDKTPACVQVCQSRALIYTEMQGFTGEKRKRFVEKLMDTK